MKQVGTMFSMIFDGEICSQDFHCYSFPTNIYVKENQFSGEIYERKPGFYTMKIHNLKGYVHNIKIDFKHWETACKKLKNKLQKIGFDVSEK